MVTMRQWFEAVNVGAKAEGYEIKEIGTVNEILFVIARAVNECLDEDIFSYPEIWSTDFSKMLPQLQEESYKDVYDGHVYKAKRYEPKPAVEMVEDYNKMIAAISSLVNSYIIKTINERVSEQMMPGFKVNRIYNLPQMMQSLASYVNFGFKKGTPLENQTFIAVNDKYCVYCTDDTDVGYLSLFINCNLPNLNYNLGYNLSANNEVYSKEAILNAINNFDKNIAQNFGNIFMSIVSAGFQTAYTLITERYSNWLNQFHKNGGNPEPMQLIYPTTAPAPEIKVPVMGEEVPSVTPEEFEEFSRKAIESCYEHFTDLSEVVLPSSLSSEEEEKLENRYNEMITEYVQGYGEELATKNNLVEYKGARKKLYYPEKGEEAHTSVEEMLILNIIHGMLAEQAGY